MNYILLGPRGVGKSKVSRALSKQTGLPVVSTDSIAVYELGGISIPSFIQRSNGDWRSFRELEFKILSHLQTAREIILDCGGGILFEIDEAGHEVMSQKKTKLLSGLGKRILLLKDIDSLIEKVQDDPTRPNLQKDQEYRKILEKRLPTYHQNSDVILSIDGMTKEEVAKKILSTFPHPNLLG